MVSVTEVPSPQHNPHPDFVPWLQFANFAYRTVSILHLDIIHAQYNVAADGHNVVSDSLRFLASALKPPFSAGPPGLVSITIAPPSDRKPQGFGDVRKQVHQSRA